MTMYLLSVDAKLLGTKAARIVGLSEEATCYVSPEYFAEDDPGAGARRSESRARPGVTRCGK